MTEEQLLAEFNSNKASLIRVDGLIKMCHASYFDEDWFALFKHLRLLRTEARYKMKHKIKDKVCEKDCIRCVCDKKFKKLSNTNDIFLQSRAAKILQTFIKQLDEFFLFLMDFMGEKGMLLRDAADEASAALK